MNIETIEDVICQIKEEIAKGFRREKADGSFEKPFTEEYLCHLEVALGTLNTYRYRAITGYPSIRPQMKYFNLNDLLVEDPFGEMAKVFREAPRHEQGAILDDMAVMAGYLATEKFKRIF